MASPRRAHAATAASGPVVVAVTVLALVAAACVPDPPLLGSVPSPTPGSVPAFSHVVVVTFENASYDEVFGPAGADRAPYLRSLADDWALAADYYGVGHASLTNYIAMTSGQAPTFRTGIDCPLYDCVYPATVRHIGDQVDAAGKTWRAYLDGMTTPCQHGSVGSLDPNLFRLGPSTYATRHNPFVYYQGLTDDPARCAAHDVPYPQLARDLAAGDLADLSFVVPDLCNDGHDADCGLPAADRWASAELPHILDDAAFRDGGVLFVTFDESESGDTAGCCGAAPGGGRIGTIVVSPSYGRRGGYRSTRPYNHYSLLRTIEDGWRFDLLGHAGNRDVAPMADLFDSGPLPQLGESRLAALFPVAAVAVVGVVLLGRRRRRRRPAVAG